MLIGWIYYQSINLDNALTHGKKTHLYASTLGDAPFIPLIGTLRIFTNWYAGGTISIRTDARAQEESLILLAACSAKLL
jgi:hypothetical protein